MARHSKIIALEEHFWIKELRRQLPSGRAERLDDLGEIRLREMDEARIDLQVISHAPPGVQDLEPEKAIALARRANDTLNNAIRVLPQRFAGFAVLPTPDPKAAADELERTVTQYGFKGAMIHGATRGRFLDDKSLWVILERAAALDVPIYVHPGTPDRSFSDTLYKDYPAVAGAGWGYNVEAGTHAIRLIMSGVFDVYPKLTIILGHLGEGLPFSLWRCDALLSGDLALKRRFRDYFCEHFFITTSGNFSHPALQCCMMEMGADRILFSVDWPYASNVEARAFMDNALLSTDDRDKILGRNAAKLLRI